jgi:hypothetical protein
MPRLRSMFVIGALLLCSGCSKKARGPKPPPVPSSSPASGTGTRPDASLVHAPAATLKPLAEGKRVRIDKLEVPALEIVVPSDFKLRIETGDLVPEAHLEGPDWQVVIREPGAGFATLEEDKGVLLRTDSNARIIHAEETVEGFVLVDQDSINRPLTYCTRVTRPALKVECGAWGLESVVDAERVASICLSLGPARGRGKRHDPLGYVPY